MTKPTVGRIVHYYEGNVTDFPGRYAKAAIICHVHDDATTVNLCVFSTFGQPLPTAWVPFRQPEDAPPEKGHYCEWPPREL